MRRYISLGVGIDRPNNLIVIYPDKPFSIKGCRSIDVYPRIIPIVEEYGIKNGLVYIQECIPKHVGLGSTTQLLLGVAHGLLLANNIDIEIIELAKKLELGTVSGVGTYVYMHGGFIVDSGKSNLDEFPSLMFRVDFPGNWRFLVAIPRGRGLDEDVERYIFEHCDSGKLELVSQALMTLITKLIPSLINRDYHEFAQSLEELQTIVGEMFSSYQGGVYSSTSQRIVSVMKNLGLKGIGQSSWGPTIYCVFEDHERAIQYQYKLRELIGNDVDLFIAKPCNRGASVEIIS